MKIQSLLIMLSIIISSCAENDSNINYVLNNFAENSKNLTRIEYNVERIDTFASGGTVWNNKGYALIERENKDNLFGFYFFGERYDLNKQFIYDGKKEFRINKDDKTYTISKPGEGFLGSPGGQMVVKEILFPDTMYKNVRLIGDTKNSYLVEYQFDDDTVYNVTNRNKIVEINKNNFLPQQVTLSYKALGNRAVHKTIISNLKLNFDVEESLDQIKRELSEYKIIEEEKTNPSINLVRSVAPEFKLPLLFDTSKYIEISKEKLTLLYFWEVWCGPCIKSLSEVEKIYKKFSGNVEVIGITTDDIENAKKLVNQKKLTFPTLIGDEYVIKDYGVNSYPRYFLIDKNGTVIKEYYGFNAQIEKDIVQLLKE